MNIILVRHGQTDWNVKNMLQGRTNIDLNDQGILQAVETAKKLKNIDIDIIYTSPLKRTLKTAEQINKYKGLNIIKDDRLVERGFGEYEGRTNVKFKKYWDFKLNVSDFNVEPIKDLFERVYSILNEIFNKYKNSETTILLVTHNGVNLVISSILNGYKSNIFEYNLKPCEYRIFKNVELIELEEDSEKHKI